MEDLTRIVAESMARHGVDTTVDHRRLQWSRWFVCDSALDLCRVPSDPGLFAVAEEIVAPGDVAGGTRMLAVLQLSHTEDLAISMARLFAPLSPFAERSGRLFARFTVVQDDTQRRSAHAAFQRWLTSSTEAASGISSDSAEIAAFPSASPQLEPEDSATEDAEPHVTPLPSGF